MNRRPGKPKSFTSEDLEKIKEEVFICHRRFVMPESTETLSQRAQMFEYLLHHLSQEFNLAGMKRRRT